MTVHRLKADQPHVGEILAGHKPLEVRLNDRLYKTSDTLQLDERDPRTGILTGQSATVIVTGVWHRVDRHWPLSEIERHGLTAMAIAPPSGYEDSSLNPHAAAGEIETHRLQEAVTILKDRFGPGLAEFTPGQREELYRTVATRILQIR